MVTDHLFFMNFNQNREVTPCKVYKNGDPIYLHDVTKPPFQGIFEMSLLEFSKRLIPLSAINPSVPFFRCLADHGADDQRYVMLAVPQTGIITPGEVVKEGNEYFVRSTMPNIKIKIHLEEFGKLFSAAQAGRNLLPWTYAVANPMETCVEIDPETQYNAFVTGMNYYGHPEFHVTHGMPPNDAIQVLNAAAQYVQAGKRFGDGDILPFQYKHQELYVKESALKLGGIVKPALMICLKEGDENGTGEDISG